MWSLEVISSIHRQTLEAQAAQQRLVDVAQAARRDRQPARRLNFRHLLAGWRRTALRPARSQQHVTEAL